MCRDKKCRLPHVDRAGQIRRNAANLEPNGDKGEPTAINEEESSDVSSEEEDYDETGSDVDSDGMDEEPVQVLGYTDKQDLAHQRDYIRL